MYEYASLLTSCPLTCKPTEDITNMFHSFLPLHFFKEGLLATMGGWPDLVIIHLL